MRRHLARLAWLALLSAAGCGEAAKPTSPPAPQPSRFVPSAGSPGGPPRLPAIQAKAPLGNTIFLAPPARPEEAAASGGLLYRELVRQTLWLAARTKFGTNVRDGLLGESPADGAGDHQTLSLSSRHLQGDRLLTRGAGPKPEILLESGMETTSPLEDGSRFVAAQVDAAAGPVTQALANAGFAPAAAEVADGGDVPPAVAALLDRADELSQFTALRLLDAERAKADTLALALATARAYATLGTLTELYWGATPHIFKARALLLTEHLGRRFPDAPAVRWHRAYVRTLAGLHADAFADLKAAEDHAKAHGSPRPAWATTLAAFLEFDSAALKTIATDSGSPLAYVLAFVADETHQTESAAIRAGRMAIAAVPDCWRVHAGLCRLGGVSLRHEVTMQPLALFGPAVKKALKTMPGLPATAKPAGPDPASERQLYTALEAAGRDPAERGELSWGALAGMCREVRFEQLWERLYFMGHMWSVPTDDVAKAALEIAAGHPFEPLLCLFSGVARVQPGLRDRVAALPTHNLDLTHMLTFDQVYARHLGAAAMNAHRTKMLSFQGEYVYRDALFHIDQFAGGVAYNRMYGLTLRRVSPNCPVAVAALVRTGETSGKDDEVPHHTPAEDKRIPEIEKRYATSACVQSAVGEYHRNAGRAEDAIRCYRQAAELSPDPKTFRTIAKLQNAAGRPDDALKSLKEILKHPDNALDHAQVNIDISKMYKARREFDKALPYAEAGAESWAGWALLEAGEVNVALKRFDRANEWFAALAERYENNCFDYFVWCITTNEMDLARASRLCEAYAPSVGNRTQVSQRQLAGIYYQVSGQHARAQKIFESLAADSPLPETMVVAGLAAWEAGDDTARDAAFARALEKARAAPKSPTSEAMAAFLEALRSDLKDHKKLDL